MKDIRQTQKYAIYMELLGWNVDRVDKNYIYSKNLFLFTIYKIQRPEKPISINNLSSLINKNRNLAVLYLELMNKDLVDKVSKNGFKKINSTSLPSKTIRFDLKKSDKRLLSEMHHKTRYNIRLSIRRGVEIVGNSNIEEFSKFWHKAAKKRNMFLSLNKEIKSIFLAFNDDVDILWAERNDKKIAAVMILYTKQAGYYMYAASTDTGYKHQAPSLLVWEAIQRCKKRNLSYFDFEGVYDERFPLESWKGFSRFKNSFGGEETEFPGALRKIYLPFFS